MIVSVCVCLAWWAVEDEWMNTVMTWVIWNRNTFGNLTSMTGWVLAIHGPLSGSQDWSGLITTVTSFLPYSLCVCSDVFKYTLWKTSPKMMMSMFVSVLIFFFFSPSFFCSKKKINPLLFGVYFVCTLKNVLLICTKETVSLSVWGGGGGAVVRLLWCICSCLQPLVYFDLQLTFAATSSFSVYKEQQTWQNVFPRTITLSHPENRLNASLVWSVCDDVNVTKKALTQHHRAWHQHCRG